MDYKPTLCLPRTDFPMKADLPRREPEIRGRWATLYADLRKARAGAERFTFHDGPPYANGDVHIGTVLNKVLKDFIVRSRNMMGKDAPFVPGWDCHGLPIEHRVMKEGGPEARTLSPAEIRKRCRALAEHFVAHQRDQYVRLGIVADWERPYLTMDPSYEDGVLSVFQDLVEKGFVTRDKRSTTWCPHCATALAEAELEYRDRESPSIHVRVQAADGELARMFGLAANDDIGLVVWTTTPWTLPANLAVAVHPMLSYVAVKEVREGRVRHHVVAQKLVPQVAKACGWSEPVEVWSKPLQGWELKGARYRPCLDVPFPAAPAVHTVVLAEYVSGEDGTGCVHTAPGHGADDFRTGQAEGLPILSPVDGYGRYIADVGPALAGKKVPSEANPAVLALLGPALLHEGKVVHSYAHCWRCKGPILFRATDQWFIKVDQVVDPKSGETLRQRAIAEIGKTRWVPEWGSRRIGGMVETRPDWCISRQRHWGIPIPAVVCSGCGRSWTTPGLVRNTRAVVVKEGADAWFDGRPAAAFLGKETCPHCGSAEGTLAKDIFDVWFESGTSWRAAVQNDPHGRMTFPSDVVIEGTDQHRGWFQLSLLPSVAVNGHAPWKTVVTNGFTVDEAGDKVSKSKGGLLHADELADKFGADVARLWVASVNYQDDVPVSAALLQKVGESYRKIRNTFRWLLGNLDGFDPASHCVPRSRMLVEDRHILACLDHLVGLVLKCYDEFDFAQARLELHAFMDSRLSAGWCDYSKDRLYCDAASGESRRSGQTAAYYLADTLARLLGPILVHTTEEVWETLPGGNRPSIHTATLPAPGGEWRDEQLRYLWDSLQSVGIGVRSGIEALRSKGEVGSSSEVCVRIAPSSGEHVPRLEVGSWAHGRNDPVRPTDQLTSLGAETLARILMVGAVVLEEAVALPEDQRFRVHVTRSSHEKCGRCWYRRPTVGKDARFPDLCARCAEVVAALPGTGGQP